MRQRGRFVLAVMGLLLLPLVATGTASARQVTEAPRTVHTASVSRPAEGEIALEGTVQAAPAVPEEAAHSEAGQLTLAVSSIRTPDDRSQTLNPPHPKTIVMGEGSPIFLAEGELARETSVASLRPGAKIRCVGANSGEGKPMVARLIVVLTPADSVSVGGAATVKVGENLLPSVLDKDAYTLFQNNPNVHGAVSVEGDALKVSIADVDAQEWSLMLGEAKSLSLVDGVSYRLSFQAKADKKREYHVIALVNQPDYHNTGLFQPFTATTEWQTFTYTFVLHDTVADHNTCPQFLLGKEPGDLYLRGVTLAATADSTIPGNLLQPIANPESFQLLALKGAEATMARESGALRIGVTKLTGGAWDVQVTPHQTALKEGAWYTLRFRAWSPVTRTLTVSSGTSTPPYHTVGLDRRIIIGPEQKIYTVTFQAKGIIALDKGVNIAPIFPLGDALGTLYLSEMTLAPGRSPVGQ